MTERQKFPNHREIFLAHNASAITSAISSASGDSDLLFSFWL
jgi:hypothetical protein